MEEKKTPKHIKPIEILEIEKAYDIVLELRESNLGDFYSINSKGVVDEISITGEKIKDITPIGLLKNLTYLSLTANRIEDISLLSSLKYLEQLYLGENRIKIIKPLLQLKALRELFIWNNPIEDIEIIKELHTLHELAFSSTRVSDLSFTADLKELTYLDVDDNNISNIDAISNLKELKHLNLDNNKIKEISKNIAQRFDWLNNALSYSYSIDEVGISLEFNPLEFPPSSVIELGPETVKNYYETSEQFGHAPLSEGRIIFIGDGSSGKTSIIQKLLYNTFTQGRAQTNGIKIENMHLQHPEDKRDLAFHIWDFGGQEIQHAVHKFFFTEGCLYALVLDNRKEEEPEYWLQQIESLGGKAPVLVVFNKQDENAAETVDRKFLKEKYPNIVGFYKTSCQTGFGIDDFKKDLEKESVKLRTVNEQFPNNWLDIKKAIQERTSGTQHYLTYETYKEICKQNSTPDEQTQKLLLRYFNTIGAVTWFGGDTYLQFLHILNPAWLTQGVYKILTAKKTATLFGQINVGDFKELLHPLKGDYTYDEPHYAYILSMMKKFDLCYTPDDKHIFIPSAFSKEPKVEYSDFKGEKVRTYILQFKDYMPLALIHRYTAKNIDNALDSNYWYTGIVTKDTKSKALTMVHADKDAKRIYVRIKDGSPLGVWEHIRRELAEITKSYAKIPYDELVLLQEKPESTVKYDDLVGYVKGGESVYFEPTLGQRFNVGYLMGLFESKDTTLEKVKKGEIALKERE